MEIDSSNVVLKEDKLWVGLDKTIHNDILNWNVHRLHFQRLPKPSSENNCTVAHVIPMFPYGCLTHRDPIRCKCTRVCMSTVWSGLLIFQWIDRVKSFTTATRRIWTPHGCKMQALLLSNPFTSYPGQRPIEELPRRFHLRRTTSALPVYISEKEQF